MDQTAQQNEVSRNFDYFQRMLALYLPIHRQQFALLRDAAVIGFFDDVGDADDAGASRFADGLYSIQQVTAEPVELGVYANAVD